MSFSLELTEDQATVQSWVHEFARDVIRPVAAEWDEREETPWPVIQEAAKIGALLLGLLRQRSSSTRAASGIPLSCIEELFWGDAGIGLCHRGYDAGLRSAGLANATQRSNSASGSRRCSAMRTTSSSALAVRLRA